MSRLPVTVALVATAMLISACGGSGKDERVEAAVAEAQRATAQADALEVRVQNLENRIEHDEGMYADGYPVVPASGAAQTPSDGQPAGKSGKGAEGRRAEGKGRAADGHSHQHGEERNRKTQD